MSSQAVLMETPDVLQKAIPLFASHADRNDAELEKALRSEGIPSDVVMQLLDFLPIAFAHALLGPMGVKLTDYYIRVDDEGTEKMRGKFMEEPVYREAMKVAVRFAAQHTVGDAFMAIASRSAELDAVNNAMNDGSNPEDLVLSPPLMFSSSNSSPPDSPVTEKKSWWRLWK